MFSHPTLWESSDCDGLEQQIPLQSPHANEHLIPCFMQVHESVLQVVLQLHLITFSRYSGAAESTMRTALKWPPSSSYPHSLGLRVMLPSQACTWRKTLAECSFADASVGGRFSAISFILLLSVIAEIHNHGYVFLVIAFGREPWDQSELPPPHCYTEFGIQIDDLVGLLKWVIFYWFISHAH